MTYMGLYYARFEDLTVVTINITVHPVVCTDPRKSVLLYLRYTWVFRKIYYVLVLIIIVYGLVQV